MSPETIDRNGCGDGTEFGFFWVIGAAFCLWYCSFCWLRSLGDRKALMSETINNRTDRFFFGSIRTPPSIGQTGHEKKVYLAVAAPGL